MGTILIVQPYRMLQQAFSTALFRDHQVQLIETIPEPERIKNADVVIVDAGALREQGALNAQELLTVKNWKIATVWIDSEKSAQPPERENLFAVAEPLTRETLQKVLAQCVKATDAAKKPPPSAAAAKNNEPGGRHQAGGKKVIELVDVVEEDSGRETSRGQQKS